MKPLFLASLLCAAVHAHAAAFVAGPYQYLPLRSEAAQLDAGTLTIAFATGECGSENWKNLTREQAATTVQALRKPYILSTGGAEAMFTCASAQGMETFIGRYLSPRLVGIDFDIEDKQTPEQVDSLLKQIRQAQRRHPRLRMGFTIATHAAQDGSQRSLNALGESIVKGIRKHGVRNAVYNLMVMNYGPAAADVCVMKEGACDMGASSLQAARNVHAKYGIPYRQIALTAMIGVNDVMSNVFTMEDAKVMAAGARKLGLAGIHFWSLDRDQPCADSKPVVSDRCSGIDAPAGAFTALLSR